VQFSEKVNASSEQLSINQTAVHKENLGQIKVLGEIFLKKEHADGTIENEVIGKNIVTLNASVLLAQLAAKEYKGAIDGLTYLAVGSGNPEWDPRFPPTASNTATQLVTEIYRKEFYSIEFINPDPAPGDPEVSPTPTNILDITARFEQGEADGFWMEMGLFGGDASASADSGTLATYKIFSLVSKPSDSIYTITYRLTF
jgi:hypothetical protein